MAGSRCPTSVPSSRYSPLQLFSAIIARYFSIALVFILLGTMMSNDLVWELTDMFNNLMVIPNAIALFALTGMVVRGADKAVKS